MLTDEQIEKNYRIFKKMLIGYVKRDGIEEFITWLDTTDAKVAPASTKYHCDYPGGYIEHSLNVFKRIFKLMQFDFGEELPYSKESIALVSLLHDVDKINKYEVYYKNVKNEQGEWDKVPGLKIKDSFDRLVFGTHSENSVFILSKYFDLTWDEMTAVLNHMGGCDSASGDISKTAMDAFTACKLAYYLREADLYSTCITERSDINYSANNYYIVEEDISESDIADSTKEVVNGEVI